MNLSNSCRIIGVKLIVVSHVNLKIKISAIVIQVKVMIGVEVKLIVVLLMDLSS